MKPLFIHHLLFRLICPPVYGIVVYLLVLLVFDNIAQVKENFFSQEVLLCIVLTFALSESLRLMIILLDKWYPIEKNIKSRIALQITINLWCTLLVISGGVAIYFVYIVGYTSFTSFTTELLTLNSIYFITSLFYTMLYLSIFYLNQHNKAKLQEEKMLRERMEHQLSQLNKEVNPELLYNSLETLIYLAHQDARQAENYIDHLSSVYRYFLNHKHKELTPVSDELQAVQHLVHLYSKRYCGHVQFQVHLSEEANAYLMIPGTLLELVEDAVLTTMISETHPLEIDAYPEGAYFVISYRRRDRLTPRQFAHVSVDEIARAYTFFTDNALQYQKTDEECVIKIPLLRTQPENTLSDIQQQIPVANTQ